MTGARGEPLGLNSRRFGQPRTEAERLARHEAVFGERKLPPRGTGLKRGTAAQGVRLGDSKPPLWGIVAGLAVAGLVLYMIFKR